jgi:putative flippase GtrA
MREAMSFFRYALVGAVATAVHYAILAALVEAAAVPAGTAAGVGALCGALVAYLLNRSVTFQAAVPHRRAAPRFFLVASFGAALSSAIVGAGTTFTQWHYLAWQGVATAIALFLTYALNRQWTFS